MQEAMLSETQLVGDQFYCQSCPPRDDVKGDPGSLVALKYPVSCIECNGAVTMQELHYLGQCNNCERQMMAALDWEDRTPAPEPEMAVYAMGQLLSAKAHAAIMDGFQQVVEKELTAAGLEIDFHIAAIVTDENITKMAAFSTDHREAALASAQILNQILSCVSKNDKRITTM